MGARQSAAQSRSKSDAANEIKSCPYCCGPIQQLNEDETGRIICPRCCGTTPLTPIATSPPHAQSRTLTSPKTLSKRIKDKKEKSKSKKKSDKSQLQSNATGAQMSFDQSASRHDEEMKSPQSNSHANHFENEHKTNATASTHLHSPTSTNSLESAFDASAAANGSTNTLSAVPALQFVHLTPFFETIPPEYKHSNEDEFLQQLIQPYFQKLLSANEAKSHSQTLPTLSEIDSASAPIATPTAAPISSLPVAQPVNSASTSTVSSATLPAAPAASTSLIVKSGARYQINGVDFELKACHPPQGRITPDTVFRCMAVPRYPLHALATIAKLHVLPTQVSVDTYRAANNITQTKLDPKELFAEFVQPYFASQFASGTARHQRQGDVFVHRGLQLRVLAAQPLDGLVTQETQIFTEGEYTPDLQRIEMRPIYESLPNNEKTITPDVALRKYLHPYFLGQYQLVHKNDRLAIDGVDWIVSACNPPEGGIVTAASAVICDAPPLRAEDLRRQQELADEEMARAMQESENAQARSARRSQHRGGSQQMSVNLISPPGQILQLTPQQLQSRLAEALASMPPDDRYRVLVQRLHDQLAMHPYANAGGADQSSATLGPSGFAAMLRAMHAQQQAAVPRSVGASQRQIDALPTRIYQPRSPPPSGAGLAAGASPTSVQVNQDSMLCLICQCEYESGDCLRTLECFHSYHKSCIDPWLISSTSGGKCPVCKHKVSR